MERSIDYTTLPPECIKANELVDETPYLMDGYQFALYSILQAIRRRDETRMD